MQNLLLFLILIFSIFIEIKAQNSADLIFFNGQIFTMDEKNPLVEAIAVNKNKVTAIGKSAEILKLAGKNTRTINVEGKTIIPGFNDSHVHFFSIGSQFSNLDLQNVNSASETLEKIKFYAKFLPPGRWILGNGWKPELWNSDAAATLELIDKLTPDHPLFIYFADTNFAFANSFALRRAGFLNPRKIVSGGEIFRDETGNPTGIVKGAATKYLRAFAPTVQSDDKIAVLQAATDYAASLGITSVQDMQTDDLSEFYRALESDGKLKTRVYDCYNLFKWKENPPAPRRADDEAMVRTGCLKGLADSFEDTKTALYKNISAADRTNYQIMVHAIGAEPNETILSIYERVGKENGAKDRRFRIEHAHNILSKSRRRLAKNNIIASMQPHLFYGGTFNDSEPYRELLDSGAKIAFGSDASITDFNPLLGIYAATMRDANNNPAKQAITVEEAARLYTVGAAYAEFQENIKGKLTPGMLADFIVLSENIFTIKPEKIPTVKVLTTVVNGKIIYRLE